MGGRRWIGCYKCLYTPIFFENLSISLGSDTLLLKKIRGHNAHHVVESTFKSFARVFRACLDELTMGGSHGCVRIEEGNDRIIERRRIKEEKEQQQLGNNNNLNKNHHRTGSRSRSTKETTIEVNVDLDRYAPDNDDDVVVDVKRTSTNTNSNSMISTG